LEEAVVVIGGANRSKLVRDEAIGMKAEATVLLKEKTFLF
jgi:hypothetical protein